MNISTIAQRLHFALLLLSSLCWNNSAEAQIITTVAGSDSVGYAGDGGAATAARLKRPCGVRFDTHGNMFIADNFNHVVRKVTTSGTISTVAGNGVSGFSGNGGPATDATLGAIYGVAADATDNIFFADYANNIVWQVNSAGTIFALAGNGTAGYSGDGGPAYAAQLARVSDVAVDGSGNIYIADQGNFRIRKVATTGTITTIAGTGTNGASGDGGPATDAQIGMVTALAADAAGNIYLTSNKTIRKVSTAGVITTIAGGGTYVVADGVMATAANFDLLTGIAIDNNGTLYTSVVAWSQVYKIDAAGIVSLVINSPKIAGFSGDGGPALNAKLSRPSGLSVDARGDLYVADANNNRIRKVTMPPSGLATIRSKIFEIKTWPNPSDGNFSLKISTATQGQKATVTITNVLGEVVRELTVQPNEDALIQSGLPSGLFNVSVEIGREKQAMTLIVR